MLYRLVTLLILLVAAPALADFFEFFRDAIDRPPTTSTGDAVLWDASNDAVLWDASGDKVLWD